jgi:hypothetical protein
VSRLYAFDRQAKLYDDAARSLHRLARQADDLNESVTDARPEVVAAHAIAVEDVLRREQGQWGQLASEIELVTPPRDK